MNMNMDPGLAMLHMIVKYPIPAITIGAAAFTAVTVYGPVVSDFAGVAVDLFAKDSPTVVAAEIEMSEEVQEVIERFVLNPLRPGVPVVSLTFDDALASQYTEAYRMLRERGMEATLYVPTGLVEEQEGWYMSEGQLQRIVQEGLWEVGGHSVYHDNLTLFDREQLEHDITTNASDLYSRFSAAPISFSTPYGSYNEAVIEAVSTHFLVHVNAWSPAAGMNDLTKFEWMDVNRLNIYNSTSINKVCERVDALKDNDWFVPIFHAVRDWPLLEDGTSDVPHESRWDVGVDHLAGILNCIQARVDRGELQVLSVARAVELSLHPEMQDPGFDLDLIADTNTLSSDDVSLLEHDLRMWAELSDDYSLFLTE